MARLSKSYQILTYTARVAAELPRYTAAEKAIRESRATAWSTVGGKRQSKRDAKSSVLPLGLGAKAEIFAGEGNLSLFAQFEVLERRDGSLYVKELEV